MRLLLLLLLHGEEMIWRSLPLVCAFSFPHYEIAGVFEACAAAAAAAVALFKRRRCWCWVGELRAAAVHPSPPLQNTTQSRFMSSTADSRIQLAAVSNHEMSSATTELKRRECAAVCEACANRTYGTQNQFEKVAARCCVPAPVSRSSAIQCATPTLHRRLLTLLCGLWHALSK